MSVQSQAPNEGLDSPSPSKVLGATRVSALNDTVRKYWSKLSGKRAEITERQEFCDVAGSAWDKEDTEMLFDLANGKDNNIDWETISKRFFFRHSPKDCKDWFSFISDLADQKVKAPKRKRRRREDIIRTYKCTVAKCEKAYGSEGALKHHFKLKHPDVDYTPRRYLYDKMMTFFPTIPNKKSKKSDSVECDNCPSSPDSDSPPPQISQSKESPSLQKPNLEAQHHVDRFAHVQAGSPVELTRPQNPQYPGWGMEDRTSYIDGFISQRRFPNVIGHYGTEGTLTTPSPWDFKMRPNGNFKFNLRHDDLQSDDEKGCTQESQYGMEAIDGMCVPSNFSKFGCATSVPVHFPKMSNIHGDGDKGERKKKRPRSVNVPYQTMEFVMGGHDDFSEPWHYLDYPVD